MTVTFTTKKHIPATLTMHQREFISSYPPVEIGFGNIFFVVARTNRGGRFYSDSTDNFDAAAKDFMDYCDLVDYFGGGTVEFFAIDDSGYDIIERAIV